VNIPCNPAIFHGSIIISKKIAGWRSDMAFFEGRAGQHVLQAQVVQNITGKGLLLGDCDLNEKW
jgi:hypothetical protein